MEVLVIEEAEVLYCYFLQVCLAAIRIFVQIYRWTLRCIVPPDLELKKYFKASPDNPPKILILGWLAVIGVFSGVLFYAIQTNNRIMVMILAAVYVAFGFYVTGRINRKNKEMVHVEYAGWRERRGAKWISSRKRAIKFILFVAFVLILGYLLIFVKTDS